MVRLCVCQIQTGAASFPRLSCKLGRTQPRRKAADARPPVCAQFQTKGPEGRVRRGIRLSIRLCLPAPNEGGEDTCATPQPGT